MGSFAVNPGSNRLTPGMEMLLVSIIWGGNFTATKIAFTEIPPLAFVALRFLMGSAILWLVIRHRGQQRTLPPGVLGRVIWLGVIGNTVYQILFSEGLALTSATQSSLIMASMPVLATLVIGALGIERVSIAQWLGVLGAFAGVVVVLLARGGSFGGGIGWGELLMLGAVVCWTGYTLMPVWWKFPMSALEITAWSFYTGTPGLVLAGLPELVSTNWLAVSWAGWSGLIYSGVLSLGFAYILWNRSVPAMGPTRVSIYMCVVPLFATVIAMVGLGERPGLGHILGGLMVVGGVLLSQWKKSPRRVASD